ncbi:TPA: HNH endonuclease [Burkholderia cepacia]|nr:HNH endonuclease [Burkholderia cepacia]
MSIARERGFTFYFNGKPCPYGHINSKYVSSGTCFVCALEKTARTLEKSRQKAAAKNLAESRRQLDRYMDWVQSNPKLVRMMVPISRDRALAIGAKFFFTGKICELGHVAERYVVSKICFECSKVRTERDREKKREYNARKYRENPTRYVESIKRWVAANPDRVKEKSARWRERNPEAKRADTQRNRAQRKGVEGRFTAMDVKRLFERQRGKCACCATPLSKQCGTRKAFHVDHIIPIAGGGTNWPHNLQLLCPLCNLKKGAKDPFEFAASMGRLF